VCVYVCIHVCIDVCMCVYMYVCMSMCVCMYVCMYVCACVWCFCVYRYAMCRPPPMSRHLWMKIAAKNPLESAPEQGREWADKGENGRTRERMGGFDDRLKHTRRTSHCVSETCPAT
jgi:hypothetical protein